MVANYAHGLGVGARSFLESLPKSRLTHFVRSPNVHSLPARSPVRVDAGTQKQAATLKIISRNILKMDKPLSFVALEQLVSFPPDGVRGCDFSDSRPGGGMCQGGR